MRVVGNKRWTKPMNKDNCCELIEKCPMFAYFSRVAEALYNMAYCEGNHDHCARRKLRLAGEEVPVNLLPQGGLLWRADEAPPEQFTMPGL